MDSSLSTKFPASYPNFDLCKLYVAVNRYGTNFYSDPPVYPYNLSSIYPHFASSLESCASPEGYPFFNICTRLPRPPTPYPSDMSLDPTTSGLVNAYLSLYLSTPRSQYPYFEICRSFALSGFLIHNQAHGLIDPGVAERTSKSKALPTTGHTENSRHHYQGYPTFNLCEHPIMSFVYPFFLNITVRSSGLPLL